MILLLGCTLLTEQDRIDRLGVDEPETASLELSGQLSVPQSRVWEVPDSVATVGLVRFSFGGTDESEFVTIGEPLAVGEVEDLALGASRPYRLDVPLVPPDEDFVDWDGSEIERGATYMIGSWFDDGDGLPGDGDVFLGAAIDQYLIYPAGEFSTDLFPDGEAWYFVSFEVVDGRSQLRDVYTVEDDFLVYDHDANMLPHVGEAQGQSFIVEPDSPDAARVTLFDSDLIGSVWVDGDDPPWKPTHGEATVGADGRATIAPLGRPEDEQLRTDVGGEDTRASGVRAVAYMAVAYDDANGNGVFDTDRGALETVYATSYTTDAGARLLVYYEAIGFESAFLVPYGFDFGWNLVAPDDGVQEWGNPIVLDDQGL